MHRATFLVQRFLNFESEVPSQEFLGIVHYEYIACAKMTPVLRKAMSCSFEPRHFVASDSSAEMCPAEFADIC